MSRRTLCTETSEGFIPHIEVAMDYGIVFAPVKLLVGGTGKLLTDKLNRPYPIRESEGLVYALPGGEEFTA